MWQATKMCWCANHATERKFRQTIKRQEEDEEEKTNEQIVER